MKADSESFAAKTRGKDKRARAPDIAPRIAIESVAPLIDCGRFSAKGIQARPFLIEADILCDGHDKLGAAIRFRRASDTKWHEVPMNLLENDRWRGVVVFDTLGSHMISIVAWRDLFGSWQAEVAKKHAAGHSIDVELVEGQEIIKATMDTASRADVPKVKSLLAALENGQNPNAQFSRLMNGETTELMRRIGPRDAISELAAEVPIWIDREKAVFSAWYELMPRSMSFSEDRHGTFDDVIKHLPYVRDLGFDVLYLPPIHPIGRTNRKGRNNVLKASPGDPGSPYAIGSDEGGHDAIHPELGDLAAFRRLIDAARAHGLEIAMDFAIQCSPDHPWIKQHPEWFDWRPDGTIKFAENPPKKYEDIVNVHFYDSAFPSLWIELRDVLLLWIDRGVRIFRVDNPHTKPLPFWEWVITEIRSAHPDVIFLSEAFTRPKMMKRLAKLGFTQSYTYFTWRNTKRELTEYLEELVSDEMPHVMRPNFFVNTPDINPVPLQTSGRAGFRVRVVLAGSLSPSWGMYNGFEICEATPLLGREEYLDSEKYQLRVWDFDLASHIKDDVRFINRIRREHPALQQLEGLRFYNAWNDHVLYYAKFSSDLSDFVLFAVNLDPHHPQGAAIEVPLWEFGLPDHASIDGIDLVSANEFRWEGKLQHVWLTPEDRPYAVWSLKNPAFAWQ